jgi:hypothetical protein
MGADGPQGRDIPACDHAFEPWLPRSVPLLRLGPMPALINVDWLPDDAPVRHRLNYYPPSGTEMVPILPHIALKHGYAAILEFMPQGSLSLCY